MARRSSRHFAACIGAFGSKLFSANPQWASSTPRTGTVRDKTGDRRYPIVDPMVNVSGHRLAREIDWHGKQVVELGGGDQLL